MEPVAFAPSRTIAEQRPIDPLIEVVAERDVISSGGAFTSRGVDFTS